LLGEVLLAVRDLMTGGWAIYLGERLAEYLERVST
jgi:hypothetical protein